MAFAELTVCAATPYADRPVWDVRPCPVTAADPRRPDAPRFVLDLWRSDQDRGTALPALCVVGLTLDDLLVLMATIAAAVDAHRAAGPKPDLVI